MSLISKTGPLSIADLTAVWTSAVDSTYGQAFITAGEGNGFEAYTQGFAQYARVSQAIDVTTQACYVLPWSGQTNPPAQGAKLATVTLTFARTLHLNVPVRLASGIIFYDEQTNDWSPTGSIPVLTGLRYTLVNDLVIMPGDFGPVTATAIAEKPGYSYNNPLPGSIQAFDQAGGGFYNGGASTVISGSPYLSYSIIAADQADMFVPQHVGQYVLFTAGANIGTIARIAAFVAPTATTGSGATLELLAVVETTTTITTPFITNELLTIKNGGTVVCQGRFVQTSHYPPMSRIAFVMLSPSITGFLIAVGYTITGQSSGMVVTISALDQVPLITPEVGVTGWRVLNWFSDLSLTVTNTLQPAGGVYPMQDGIGADKNLPRLPGETDAQYAKRLSTIADVVTPNAIKRALNKTLAGIPWCLREVGYPLLPGFFYDDQMSSLRNFYDLDAVTIAGTPTGHFLNGERVIQVQGGVVVRGRALAQYAAATTLLVPGQPTTTGIPGAYSFIGVAGIQGGSLGTFTIITGTPIVGKVSGATVTPTAIAGGLAAKDRWAVYLDFQTFRAFFIVGVPNLDFGDFGFFWGAGNGSYGLQNFYDMPVGFNDFYDGFPVGSESVYEQVYANVDTIRAGGVFWELVIADTACL
jgi:hypothetical protein